MANRKSEASINLDDEMKDLDRFLDEEAEPISLAEDGMDDAELDGKETEGSVPAQAVADLQEENAALQDKLMRALAEAENQRKRGERDRRDAEIYGGRKLARDLLSVYDNMKRALDAATDEQREANKALFEGIELTQRELINAFSKHQIVPINPEQGEKFDPEIHEAMYEAPVPGVDKGCVAQVMNEGFMIAERLLRPAQVGVSSGSPT